MKYGDLRDFIEQLEAAGDQKRVYTEISPRLEMTEICDRTLRAAGPALLFERPIGSQIPVLANLFGTPQRVALAMGATDVAALRDVGELLAALKEPEAPQGLRDALGKVAQLKSATALRGFAALGAFGTNMWAVNVHLSNDAFLKAADISNDQRAFTAMIGFTEASQVLTLGSVLAFVVVVIRMVAESRLKAD